MQVQINPTVRRRRVFYIPGYDPHPPRRYRELYRSEGAAQAGICGYEISMQQRTGAKGYGWQVKALIDGVQVDSEFEVLVWSDLVQSSMKNTVAATYLQMIQTVWIYLSTGVFRRLMWLSKGPIIAALFPVVMLIAQALVAISLGWLAGTLFAAITFAGAGWLVALPVFVLVLGWFKKHDGRFYAYYLMHDYAFTAKLRGRTPPELEMRIDAFRATIAAALASDVDEVLVVGHSSGAHLAISILAKLIQDTGIRAAGPKLGFLSLGQVVPMVSFLPDAGPLRADLRALSMSDALTWIDVSAPGDGCSFALCDPVAVSGVADVGKRWPLVLSAAFSQTLSPARWKSLKRRYFRLHFQYLCAFDRPGEYDYFQITAGPKTLADRFAGRAPSSNRIDVSASPHTSLVA